MNKKDKFHFDILKRIALGEANAFDKIALSFDFDHQQINTLCDVFEEFEEKEFNYIELEARLGDTLGLNYQELKTIIHYLYDDSRYTDVIFQYLKSNKGLFGNLSSEYNSIARELGI